MVEILSEKEFKEKYGIVGRGKRESVVTKELKRLHHDLLQVKNSPNVILVERYNYCPTTVNKLRKAIVDSYKLKAVVSKRKDGSVILVIRK